jgi:O-antigen/teichoic acid export membrane protein
LAVAFCLSPILVLIAANFFFFRSTFRKYRPSFSKIKFSYAKDLFNLGIIFFTIQVAGIIQYQTANIIIAQNFTTANVTSYNIVYKYFGILNMIFIIFLTPFWSASTDAFFRKDLAWIKNAIKKYNKLNVAIFLLGLLMLVLSSQIYDLWLGKGKVLINFDLSLWGFIYFTITIFASKYVYFLNGINALRIQFIASIVSPFVYIGTALLLIQYLKIGVYGLFVASIIANFNGFFLAPLQYHMVINKNKKGIWIK